MRKGLSLVAGLVLVLAGCASDRGWSTIGFCEHGNSEGELSRYEVDELDLMLPPGSKLVQSNTEDARYWVWETSVGTVSVSWVSEIARQSRLESMSTGACRVEAIGTVFTADWAGREMTAVSDALLQNGAGLLVRVEELPASGSSAESLEILRRIRAGSPPADR